VSDYGAERPILIVEDDPDILITLSEILEFEGYKVELATNGQQGLEVMQRIQPALILLDMRMPIMNGWDFARVLSEGGVKVPILVMTAAQDARRWAQEIGAQGYIEKPFHINHLLSSIESALGYQPDGNGSGEPPAVH
jgi:urea transport system substrate-binding protein